MKHKNVVITGSANGIGKALANLYLNAGANVWGIDQNAESLEAFKNEAKRFGNHFHPIQCDVSNSLKFADASKEIFNAAGEIDVWVNNAGISGLGDFMARGFDEFEKVIQINLNALALGTRLAISHMQPNCKGSIVNVASVAGHIAAPYLAAYSASKFAVVGFSQALREELKLKSIPVKIILVSPGFVNTQMIAKGTEFGYPEYLSFLLANAESVAQEIYSGIEKGKEDIFPTLNGKVLASFGKFFPNVTVKGSRLLLAKSVKDLVFFRKTPPT